MKKCQLLSFRQVESVKKRHLIVSVVLHSSTLCLATDFSERFQHFITAKRVCRKRWRMIQFDFICLFWVMTHTHLSGQSELSYPCAARCASSACHSHIQRTLPKPELRRVNQSFNKLFIFFLHHGILMGALPVRQSASDLLSAHLRWTPVQ